LLLLPLAVFVLPPPQCCAARAVACASKLSTTILAPPNNHHAQAETVSPKEGFVKEAIAAIVNAPGVVPVRLGVVFVCVHA
jgi:hypothetical protein